MFRESLERHKSFTLIVLRGVRGDAEENSWRSLVENRDTKGKDGGKSTGDKAGEGEEGPA